MHLVNADYRNFKQDDISLIRNKLLTNITVEERALLQNAHPVMVLAVNKCNETISNIIEVYLQTFDPVLVSDETCSTSLRNEAWRFLRKTSKSGFYCLNQLNSQLLATSRINKVYLSTVFFPKILNSGLCNDASDTIIYKYPFRNSVIRPLLHTGQTPQMRTGISANC